MPGQAVPRAAPARPGPTAAGRALWTALAVLAVMAGVGCRGSALRRSLAPQQAEFLSKVRYIITPSEEKIFLKLPESQRDAFITEFWKRRDPDPYSAENEFRDEYLSRLETANRLFLGEGKPGWLTDRGRIYILFGPPLDRIINPISSSAEERCAEVWYYGGFPVLFRDPNCLGRFELETYDMTPIREYNMFYMQQLNEAQDKAQKTYYRKREPFGFRGKVNLSETGSARVDGVISLSIPYAGIWFGEPQVGSLVTTVEVEISLRDAAGRARWTFGEAFEISIRDETLEREQDSSYTRDIPFGVAGSMSELRREKLRFEVRLRNRTGGEEAYKIVEFPQQAP